MQTQWENHIKAHYLPGPVRTQKLKESRKYPGYYTSSSVEQLNTKLAMY